MPPSLPFSISNNAPKTEVLSIILSFLDNLMRADCVEGCKMCLFTHQGIVMRRQSQKMKVVLRIQTYDKEGLTLFLVKNCGKDKKMKGFSDQT